MISRNWPLALVMLVSLSSTTFGQDWPTRTVRVIVPVTPGSAIDLVARTVGAGLSQQLGQSVIVDNRPGGVGTIAAGAVAKADPDGYTLLAHSAAHTLTPAVMAKPPYDTANDFAAVAPLMNSPLILVVSPKKYKSLDDLIRKARDNPGVVNYAVIGVGGATHVATERFRLKASVKMQPVSYKGTPEAITDILAGDIDFFLSPILAVLPLLHDHQLLGLAVMSSTRASALPDVRTIVEAGFKDSNFDFWIGLFAPAKTPKTIIDKLGQEALKAVQTSEAKARFAALGGDPMPPMTPAEFGAYVNRDIKSNGDLVKEAGITPQ